MATIAELNNAVFEFNRAISFLQGLSDETVIADLVSDIRDIVDKLRGHSGVAEAATAQGAPVPVSAPAPTSGVKPNVTAAGLPNPSGDAVGGVKENQGVVLSPGNVIAPELSGPINPSPADQPPPEYATPQGDSPTVMPAAAPVQVADGANAGETQVVEPENAKPAEATTAAPAAVEPENAKPADEAWTQGESTSS